MKLDVSGSRDPKAATTVAADGQSICHWLVGTAQLHKHLPEI
jgi:hypothetical protein